MAKKKRCDRNHAIYMITCQVTGERYIGITVIRGRAFQGSVKARWEGHIYHAMVEMRDYPIQRAIRLHGPESFRCELMKIVRGKQAAHNEEITLIRELKPELNVEGTERKKNAIMAV